jgi:hypothetical protein
MGVDMAYGESLKMGMVFGEQEGMPELVELDMRLVSGV